MGAHERVLALVFTGGDPPTLHDQRDLTEPALVIAADAGLHHAQRLGYRVDVVVGDLDSADPAAVAAAEAAGATVERHPVAKDASDLELALAAALDRGCTEVVVLGGHGGRLDHFLANTLLLASPELAAVRVEARFDGATVLVVRDRIELHGAPGDLLTLLPLGGPANGVVTEGLRYPLRSETLHPGSTRGLSNELTEAAAVVTVADGVLLAVVPRPDRAPPGKATP
jgi:thiamine pyrophosphokinase